MKRGSVVMELLTHEPTRPPGAQVDRKDTIGDVIQRKAGDRIGYCVVCKDLCCEEWKILRIWIMNQA